jgi:hypothetical protein
MSSSRDEAGRRRRRSVYESRFDRPSDVEVIVQQGLGRVVGFETDAGRFVEMPPCCSDPSKCEKEECWRPWP